MRRLLLVRHAATTATRSFAFPVDEPLDERGLADARALRSAVPARYGILSSPSRRCLETVEAAGLGAAEVAADLAECDFGSWAGRTLHEVAATDPREVEEWMTDADACPHDGESLRDFTGRVGRWLDEEARRDGGAAAITHGGVVKAAVVHALKAPLDAFWRIDAAPLSITELHAHDGTWTVTRVNCPVDA